MQIHTKAVKVFILGLLFCFTGIRSYATAWTTAVAGPITTLTNWTDGASGTPTSFITPGDTWTITLAMTMPVSGTWTVGTPATTPVTLTVGPGSSLTVTGTSVSANINVYGDVHLNGGGFLLSGTACQCTFNITGNFTHTTGTFTKSGNSCNLFLNLNGNYTMSSGSIDMGGTFGVTTLNVNGHYTMTGGTLLTTNVSCMTNLNVKGNFSASGPSSLACTGGAQNIVHLQLLTGTMLIDNTSTGIWSRTFVYVDAGSTAQLVGNFSSNMGDPSIFGLIVNGTLICPASFSVNGSGCFTLNAPGTLVVASPTGITGNITTTGSVSMSASADYTFNGTTPQVTGIYLPISLINATLTISNPAGVTLTQAVGTTASLIFTAGILHSGVITMSVPGTPGGVIGAGPTSYVDGVLVKTITGLTAIDYEVGDVNYAPVSLALAGAGTGGSIGVRVINGMHPNVSTSGLAPLNMANHYWKINNYTAAGPATVALTATYNAVDIIGGSNATFHTQRYASIWWLGAPLVTTNTVLPYTSSPVAGVALASLAGEYIFGDTACGTMPITGTTSVCIGTPGTLSSGTSGGTWASSSPGIATVSATGVVTGLTAGTAVVSYTESGCTVVEIVTVNALPVAGVIAGPGLVCVGDTIFLTNLAMGGGWSSLLPSFATISPGGMVVGVSPGIDTIFYTVTNICGTAIAKKVVNVVNASACVVAGVADTPPAIARLGIYPNPNTGRFTLWLASPENENAHIVISDLVGRQVKEVATTTNSKTEIILKQPPGIYIVSVATTNDKYFMKIIVE